MKAGDSLLVELGLTHLSREVRLRLVHELIDSLAAGRSERESAPPRTDLGKDLEQRLRECAETPEGLIPWSTFRRQLQEDSDG